MPTKNAKPPGAASRGPQTKNRTNGSIVAPGAPGGKAKPTVERMAKFMSQREAEQAALAKQPNPDATPPVTPPEGRARTHGGAQGQDVADGAQEEDQSAWPPCARDIFIPHNDGSPTEPVRYAVHWRLAQKLWADQAIGALDAGLSADERLDLGRAGVLILSPFEADQEPGAGHSGARRPSQRRSSKVGRGAETWQGLPPLRPPDGDKPPPQRDVIYSIARECGLDVFRSPDGRKWADIPEGDGRRTVPLARGGGASSWLARGYRRVCGCLPSSSALADTVAALVATADDPRVRVRVVSVRVAHIPGRIVIDLGKLDGRAVTATPEGWTVGAVPDGVRFLRPPQLGELPDPVRKAPPLIDVLRPVLGPMLDDDDSLILLGAWLFGTMLPGRGGLPHLALYGPQGSAKTATARFLKGLIDPVTSGDGAGTAPRDPRDLVARATAAHVLALDNLSYITQVLSDLLCLFSTGGDIDERLLYTNAELHSVNVLRACIFTAIAEVAASPDLLDRSIVVTLKPPTPRRPQREVERLISDAAPKALGSLLDAAVVALGKLDHVPQLPDDLRLADFAAWTFAGAHTLGFDPEVWIEVYRANRREAAASVAEGSRLIVEVQKLANRPDGWGGTLDQLYASLNAQVDRDDRPKDWPSTARALASRLRRLEPVLEGVHEIAVVRPRGGKAGRIWTVSTSSCKAAPDGDGIVVTGPWSEPEVSTSPLPLPGFSQRNADNEEVF